MSSTEFDCCSADSVNNGFEGQPSDSVVMNFQKWRGVTPLLILVKTPMPLIMRNVWKVCPYLNIQLKNHASGRAVL